MAHSDAFAFKNSGLNEFLLAEVGTEINGSPLTVLSLLARLGKDPWAEAAKWSRLPKASIIDRLAEAMSKMPLNPQALFDARATAGRLVLLLPSQMGSRQIGSTPDGSTQEGSKQEASKPITRRVSGRKVIVPSWVPLMAVIVVLAVWIAYDMTRSTGSIESVTPMSDQVTGGPPTPAH